jgi:diguanylate cyclase (GGDEF)-like protein
MGLRGRLAVFFVAITVIPLTVAVLALQFQLGSRTAEIAQREVQAAGVAGQLAVAATRARAGDLATELGRVRLPQPLVDRDARTAQLVVDESVEAVPGRVDIVAVVAAEGDLLAKHVSPPDFAAGVDASPPTDDELAAVVRGEQPLPGALLEIRDIHGVDGSGRLGWVATGIWADEELLARIPRAGGSAFLSDGAVLAAGETAADTVPTSGLPRDGEVRQLDIGEHRVQATTLSLNGGRSGAGEVVLALWQDDRPGLRLGGFMLWLLVPAVIVAALVGWALASSVAAPVGRAARVARAIAAGDLQQTLEPTGGKELADLAGALNVMSAELRDRLEQLELSRNQLRRSLSRLGQTLSSSLDLDRTLAVVVETAIETLGADRGMLWLFTPERDALYVKVGRRVGSDVIRLPTGAGVAGHVARVGAALRLPADRDSVPYPTDDEPGAVHQLAVPMVGRGRVLGVLSILGDDPERAFTQDDLDTLRSFAAQASVAMENVMLHQEAQRLSVTDPLTGLWNFRYFQLQADRELESAARFERPLSLLIIDLDHFKTINDRFGHQVGDDVLVEVARRIQAATRVPDVVARYGGEEFVVLLPGTDAVGAVATAERIRQAVSASKVTITTAQDIAPMAVSCSIGVAEHPAHGTTVAGLLRSADAAMYQAKAQGRDRVTAAGSGPSAGDGHSAALSAERPAQS